MIINDSDINRFWSKVKKTETCWIWTSAATRSGYGVININKKTTYAHRLSWEIHNNEQVGDRFIMHSCDNPICVNPSHLSAGTHEDNMRDMFSKGRRGIGSEHPYATINEEIAIEIRKFHENGLSNNEISKSLNVNIAIVANVVRGDMWVKTVDYRVDKKKAMLSRLRHVVETEMEYGKFCRGIGTFKRMWLRKFGNLDSVPDIERKMVEEKYEELKNSYPKWVRRKNGIWGECHKRYKLKTKGPTI